MLGSFCGRGKPEPLEEYLREFIDEMSQAMSAGVRLNELLTVSVQLECVICDSVARAYIKQIKGHAGYQGCDRCTVEGRRISSNRTVFLSCTAPLRFDIDFRSKRDRRHHIGISPMEQLPIDMVRSFPVDPMHLVFLGVVKRIVGIWKSADRNSGVRLSGAQMRQIESQLSASTACLPLDFPRKCSSLQLHERWKATEGRQFLLYVGPVALRHALPPKMYENFMVLSSCIYVLSHPIYCRSMLSFVRPLIVRFIRQFKKLYGEDEVVYNVHVLSHLCDDVEKYGPLNKFWAFPFETFMRSIKRDVRGPKCPAAQVHNRMTERVMAGISQTTTILHDDNNSQLSYIPERGYCKVNNSWFISHLHPDNCVYYKSNPYLIDLIIGPNAHCRQLQQLRSLYKHAFPSTELMIFIAGGLSSVTTVIPLSDLFCKGFCVLYESQYFVFPILHTIRDS